MRLIKSKIVAAMLVTPTVSLADPCTAPVPAQGTGFSGTVRYVGDGDSICVGKTSSPSEWIEVRVADFYAPELHSSGGSQAKAAMERIVMGKTLQCVAGRRSYDRVVAQRTYNGTSLGDLVRREGVAESGR